MHNPKTTYWKFIFDKLARDAMVELAILVKDLNSKRPGSKKGPKYDLIINWLKNLSGVPSLNDKLELKKLIESIE